MTTETPTKSRRRPYLLAAGAIAAAAVIAGGIAIAVNGGDTSPAPATATADSPELDSLIADADAEQSQREMNQIPLPTVGTERITISNHTTLPAIVVMTGDDLCHLAGGVVLQSSPSQCSVDIPNVLGKSDR